METFIICSEIRDRHSKYHCLVRGCGVVPATFERDMLAHFLQAHQDLVPSAVRLNHVGRRQILTLQLIWRRLQDYFHREEQPRTASPSPRGTPTRTRPPARPHPSPTQLPAALPIARTPAPAADETLNELVVTLNRALHLVQLLVAQRAREVPGSPDITLVRPLLFAASCSPPCSPERLLGRCGRASRPRACSRACTLLPCTPLPCA